MIYDELAPDYPPSHSARFNKNLETWEEVLLGRSPYTFTAQIRRNTYYGLLLVNKQCSAEFIETLARKKNALHKDAGEWQQLDVQDPASGLSELGYRCKIIIDYGCEAPDYIRANAPLPSLVKDYKRFIEYLPQWIASIPNVRNVEKVHADRHLEMKTYEPGQNWPVVSTKSRDCLWTWNKWMYDVPGQATPHPGLFGYFWKGVRLSVQRSLILNTLLTLQSVDSIRRVKIRVFGVADGFDDNFRRGEGEAAFTHPPR